MHASPPKFLSCLSELPRLVLEFPVGLRAQISQRAAQDRENLRSFSDEQQSTSPLFLVL